MTVVITLLAYGCPPQAIVAAFSRDERPVKRVQAVAGEHCEEVHEHLVEQPRDLQHVQADEIWVKAQGVIIWLAMALQVETRLWWGAEMGERLAQGIAAARARRRAVSPPVVVCRWVHAYVQAIRDTFRESLPSGQPGRPRLRPWDGIQIAQVVKQYAGRRVVEVVRRICQGTAFPKVIQSPRPPIYTSAAAASAARMPVPPPGNR